MALSGSVDYKMTRADLIEHSLALIGIKGIGKTVSAEDTDFCQNSLNLLIKSLQRDHPHLWSTVEAVLFLEQYEAEYTLGNGSTDAKACLASDAVINRLDAALVATNTSVTVESTTGMAASDNIGIVQDDGTTYWTTIVSVDSSTTLTLTTGMVSAAAVDNKVYTFTSRINKPLKITSMRQVQGFDSGSSTTLREVELVEMSRKDYSELPNKTINATQPTHFYYQPERLNGKLSLYPRPDTGETYIKFTMSRPLEDVDSQSDDLDLPSEWHEALAYLLAMRIAPTFGKGKKAQAEIAPIAQSLYMKAAGWDTEDTSIFLGLDDGRTN